MNKTTKSAQFTPGPWVIEKGWNGDRPTITAKVSKTQVIDNRGLIADLEHTPFIEHAQANATLIAAAPAMYDRHKDNHGMVQEALRYLYEGEYEEVKCLLNHIALNSKHAVRQAEGR